MHCQEPGRGGMDAPMPISGFPNPLEPLPAQCGRVVLRRAGVGRRSGARGHGAAAGDIQHAAAGQEEAYLPPGRSGDVVKVGALLRTHGACVSFALSKACMFIDTRFDGLGAFRDQPSASGSTSLYDALKWVSEERPSIVPSLQTGGTTAGAPSDAAPITGLGDCS